MKENKLAEKLIVPPGKKISLKKDYDPGDQIGALTSRQAEARLAQSVRQLAEFQDKLYAQNR